MDGGCLAASSYLPFRKIVFLGQLMGVPNDAETVLRDMYGPGWTVPTGKGYKRFICKESSGVRPSLYLLLLSTALLPLFFLYSRHRAAFRPQQRP